MTLIEYNTNQTLNTTINLPSDGLLRGTGSKQVVITSTANPIISVGSNFASMFTRSALIENLVIVGNGANVGVLLQNVVHCRIRNITVVNCDVGVRLTASGDNWTEANEIEHVRIKDVNKGIQFTPGGSPDNSRAFTYINDVGISLNNAENLRGIEVGTGCRIYSSFIKANVWSSQACDGMWIDGLVNLCLINFNHEKTTAGQGGSGVHIAANGNVCNNQSFFLSSGNMQNNRWVYDQSGLGNDIVEKHY
ncbi:MAG: hypothetical protein NWF01_12005 [Candidatus Bathyarchaeota archaeon]|nr:hypothetical protein [Candidatus Bathyarchaeota archaeon]